MVYIGTGKFFETGDNTSTDVQTFYGVRDKGSASETKRSHLLEQTFSASATPEYRQSSGSSVDYPTERGFYIDLKVGSTLEGERLIGQPLVTKNRVFFNSLVPVASEDACTGGGLSSWTTELTLFDGSAPAASVFGDPSRNTNSRRLDGGGGGIGQIGKYGYISTGEGDGGITEFRLPGDRQGRQSWRQVR
jgi:type IV pilus assembly protein PilY1